MSGVMFADDFVGVSESPEGLQKQIEKALENTINRKWRAAAKNVKICAVVVCYKGKVNPVTFEWKWVEDEFPIAD